MKPLVIVEDGDKNICRILINRPEVKNALNQATIAGLTAAFQSASTNPHVRAIILSAVGTDAFCAGADLSELGSTTTLKEREEFFTSLSTLIQTIHSAPQTVIASVHGFALAGGCGLAAAADIVFAADDAQFGLPELHVGLVPMVVMPVIHRAIGRRALAHLVLTAERINAVKALEVGLVTKVFAKSDLETQTNAIAVQVASLAPEAACIAKKLLYQVGENDYQQLLQQLPQKIAALSLEPEAHEGITAFLQKRRPQWGK